MFSDSYLFNAYMHRLPHPSQPLDVICWQLDGNLPIGVMAWMSGGLNVDQGRLELPVLFTFTQFLQVRHEVCRARFSISASSYLPCT